MVFSCGEWTDTGRREKPWRGRIAVIHSVWCWGVMNDEIRLYDCLGSHHQIGEHVIRWLAHRPPTLCTCIRHVSPAGVPPVRVLHVTASLDDIWWKSLPFTFPRRFGQAGGSHRWSFEEIDLFQTMSGLEPGASGEAREMGRRVRLYDGGMACNSEGLLEDCAALETACTPACTVSIITVLYSSTMVKQARAARSGTPTR